MTINKDAKKLQPVPEALLQAAIRYPNKSDLARRLEIFPQNGNLGVSGLYFNNVPVEWDENCTAGCIYYINTKLLKLKVSRARTSWHDNVPKARKILLLKGRIKFVGAKSSAPFPSEVVIFGGAPAYSRWTEYVDLKLSGKGGSK